MCRTSPTFLVDPEGARERRDHWEKTAHALLRRRHHVLYGNRQDAGACRDLPRRSVAFDPAHVVDHADHQSPRDGRGAACAPRGRLGRAQSSEQVRQRALGRDLDRHELPRGRHRRCGKRAPAWANGRSAPSCGTQSEPILATTLALSMAAQLALLLGLPFPSYLSWAVIAAAGAATVLSFAILAQYFPKEAWARQRGAWRSACGQRVCAAVDGGLHYCNVARGGRTLSRRSASGGHGCGPRPAGQHARLVPRIQAPPARAPYGARRGRALRLSPSRPSSCPRPTEPRSRHGRSMSSICGGKRQLGGWLPRRLLCAPVWPFLCR